MAFADNLKKLPGVDSVEKIELNDAAGKIVAILENKPGQAGSLAVYAYLLGKYRKIDSVAATEGLELFAEHTAHAEQNPGKHPNIDRLLDVVKRQLVYSGTVTAR
jgi:hypothetical protein